MLTRGGSQDFLELFGRYDDAVSSIERAIHIAEVKAKRAADKERKEKEKVSTTFP